MSTSVGALRNIMTVRLAMQDSGTTKPHPSVVKATRQLIEKLAVLDPTESVEISYIVEPFHVKYIRAQTGEILAEILEDEQT